MHTDLEKTKVFEIVHSYLRFISESLDSEEGEYRKLQLINEDCK